MRSAISPAPRVRPSVTLTKVSRATTIEMIFLRSKSTSCLYDKGPYPSLEELIHVYSILYSRGRAKHFDWHVEIGRPIVDHNHAYDPIEVHTDHREPRTPIVNCGQCDRRFNVQKSIPMGISGRGNSLFLHNFFHWRSEIGLDSSKWGVNVCGSEFRLWYTRTISRNCMLRFMTTGWVAMCAEQTSNTRTVKS